jgi:hypothetical protein
MFDASLWQQWQAEGRAFINNQNVLAYRCPPFFVAWFSLVFLGLQKEEVW